MTDRPFDRSSVVDWINVLHHALAEPKDSPRAQVARDVAQQALLHIRSLGRAANAQEQIDIQPTKTQVGGATALDAAGAGTGELFAGLRGAAGELAADPATASPGAGFTRGAGEYRSNLEALNEAHPWTGLAGQTAGTAASIMAAPVSAAEQVTARGAMTAKGVIPLRQVIRAATENPRALLRGAAGAAAPAALQGFATGGQDVADVPGRMRDALVSALLAAPLGALMTGTTRGQKLFGAERDAQAAQRLNRQRITAANASASETRARLSQSRETAGTAPVPNSPPEPILAHGMTETQLRDAMTKQGVEAAAIERQLATWKAGPPVSTPSPLEPIAGTEGRGFSVEGPPTPPAPSAPTVAEMRPTVPPSPLDALGRGKILPYYSRGGAAAQAIPPGPSISPSGGIGTAAAQLKLLLDLPEREFKSAAPFLAPDMLARVTELRKLGLTGAHVEGGTLP